jgi:hypothetical protein
VDADLLNEKEIGRALEQLEANERGTAETERYLAHREDALALQALLILFSDFENPDRAWVIPRVGSAGLVSFHATFGHAFTDDEVALLGARLESLGLITKPPEYLFEEGTNVTFRCPGVNQVTPEQWAFLCAPRSA